MKTSEIIIPDELKKFAFKKKIARVAFFLVLFACAVFVLVNWGDIIFKVKEKDIGFRYLFYAIFLAIPFFVTKIWLVFTDSNYVGVVKDIKIKTVVDSSNAIKPTYETLYKKNVTFLYIETSKSTIRKRVSENTKYEEKFKIGDTVLHLHGTGLTVVLPCDSDKYWQCAACGRNNDISSAFCERCARPVVRK